MIYEFECTQHGSFEVKRPMSECSEMGNCPECGAEGQRVFSRFTWFWAGEAYRSDGSRRPDSDYAPVMRG